MELLARCFLLVFAQLYVGGLLALSIPPFHAITRGFYKSTATVYLTCGAVSFAGRIHLWLQHRAAAGLARADALELLLWAISLAAAAAYLHSLWGEAFRWRARVYVVSWAAGVLALAIGAQAFRPGAWLFPETMTFPVQIIVSALVLGTVTTGMLLGHWYLIDRNLSIEPFRQVFSFFVLFLAVQMVVSLVFLALLRLAGSPEAVEALSRLFREHQMLLTARVLISPLAAAGLAWMIWKTLQIPQTMAATGLFYIAILAVLVGEMLGRFILFRTALPL